jgi:hypothetical protein
MLCVTLELTVPERAPCNYASIAFEHTNMLAFSAKSDVQILPQACQDKSQQKSGIFSEHKPAERTVVCKGTQANRMYFYTRDSPTSSSVAHHSLVVVGQRRPAKY